MDRLRRVSSAVTIVLGVALSLSGLPTHQTSALGTETINLVDVRLVAQNFNVLAGTQFRFTVDVLDATVRNQLEQDPTTTLRITVFAPVTTREQVRSITEGAEPVRELAVADLRLIQLAQT